MRLPTTLATTALAVSVIALVVSVIAVRYAAEAKVSQAALDARIEEALRLKEKAYVQELTPKLEQAYRDMLPDYTPFENPPETFSELLKPATRIILMD